MAALARLQVPFVCRETHESWEKNSWPHTCIRFTCTTDWSRTTTAAFWPAMIYRTEQ